MPRKSRLSVPGALHHVMSRGIEGRDIFGDDGDRATFLRLLNKGIQDTGFLCYAWALMNNHYHLLLRANEKPLSALMRPLNATYARFFSKRSNRRGYLFQDRFKSIATQDQGYIEELVRYVHLNPIRAGVCATMAQLDTYEWCGHSMLVGTCRFPFQNTADVLKKFASDTRTARRRYRRFIEEGLDGGDTEPFLSTVRRNNAGEENTHDYGCWVIGNREFVVNAFKNDKRRRARIAEYGRLGWDLKRLCAHVAERMSIEEQDVLSRGRKNLRAESRKLVAYLGHRVLGHPVSEIAAFLGTSGPAVSKSLDEGEEIASRKRIRIVT
jgi:putative transposase